MSASCEHKWNIKSKSQGGKTMKYNKFYSLIKYKSWNKWWIKMNGEITANVSLEHKTTNLFCTFDSVFCTQEFKYF